MARYTKTDLDADTFRGFDDCAIGTACTEATLEADLSRPMTESEYSVFKDLEPASANVTNQHHEYFREW